MSKLDDRLTQRALVVLLMLPEPFTFIEARAAMVQASDAAGWYKPIYSLKEERLIEPVVEYGSREERYRVSDLGKEWVCPTQE